jgi:hypothetical protein
MAEIEIASEVFLTIDAAALIKQFGGAHISNSGSIILNSGTQLMTVGTVSGLGSFTYNRELTASNWYLMSSPFTGQDINLFVSVEDLQTNDSNVALVRYTTNNNTWNYYQSGDARTGDFPTGIGYIIILASVGSVAFTGGFQNNDVSIALTTSGSGYNL